IRAAPSRSRQRLKPSKFVRRSFDPLPGATAKLISFRRRRLQGRASDIVSNWMIRQPFKTRWNIAFLACAAVWIGAVLSFAADPAPGRSRLYVTPVAAALVDQG